MVGAGSCPVFHDSVKYLASSCQTWQPRPPPGPTLCSHTPPDPGLRAAMASGLLGVVVLTLCVIFCSYASADDKDCQSYRDITNTYHSAKRCYSGFCCGTCHNRYCCHDSFWRLSEDKQDDCLSSMDPDVHPMGLIFGIMTLVGFLLIIICCCVCPCCCLYKMCRKPRPVIATTTHTTVVNTAPQPYPQQPAVVHAPVQPYPGGQYQPSYQPIPVQPPYAAQPSSTYQGQPYVPGPPPTYQEATGPAYPAQPMPYSQAAFGPGQPPYPLQTSAHPQAIAGPSGPDFLTQPAYNPDYVAPPPKMG